MDSKNIIVSLIYYIGVASCAAQGAEKGKYENHIPMLHYIVNAFGGGFIRDIIFLGVYPWLLTSSALPDLVLATVIGLLFTHYFFISKTNKKFYSIITRIVIITDTFGLGSFVCIGMDKAFIYSDNIFTVIACGYITAIGGGILASEKPLTKIFNSKATIYYHFVTLLGCCYYYIFRHSLCLVFFIAMVLFLVSIDYRILYNPYRYNLIPSCLEAFLIYPTISKKNNNFMRQRYIKNPKNINIYLGCAKIYLIQQRIRQC